MKKRVPKLDQILAKMAKRPNPTDKQYGRMNRKRLGSPQDKLQTLCSGMDGEWILIDGKAPGLSNKHAEQILRSLAAIRGWETRRYNALPENNPQKQLIKRRVMS